MTVKTFSVTFGAIDPSSESRKKYAFPILERPQCQELYFATNTYNDVLKQT